MSRQWSKRILICCMALVALALQPIESSQEVKSLNGTQNTSSSQPFSQINEQQQLDVQDSFDTRQDHGSPAGLDTANQHVQDMSTFASFGDLAPGNYQPDRRSPSYDNPTQASFVHKTKPLSGKRKILKKKIIHHHLQAQEESPDHQSYGQHLSAGNPPFGMPSYETKPSHHAGYPEENLYGNPYGRGPSANSNANYENPYGLGHHEAPSYLTSASHSVSKLAHHGFGVSEIICTAVALAIGALILGAPIFLIYLVIMGGMGGSSGSLSLINTVAPSPSTIMGTLTRAMKTRSAGAELRNGKGPGTSEFAILVSQFLDNPKVKDISKRLIDSFEMRFSKL